MARQVATSRQAVAMSMTPLDLYGATMFEVSKGPAIEPRLPPAMMTPNSRCACPGRKTSVMKLQKTETTKRLNTLNQT